MINKTKLYAQNKFEAIKTLSILIVIYSFNVIKWNIEKI